MIEYKKMSLFDAPEGSIIVHACNAQGVWGRGIAKEFKNRYPLAFNGYRDYCFNNGKYGNDILGTAFTSIPLISSKEHHRVVCLITSEGYADKTDPEYMILVNTTLAMIDFLRDISPSTHVYSNKFNSGLFNVPWEKTEYIINKLLENYPNIKWIVCSQD